MAESLSPTDIVTPEKVSVSMLKAAFDSAFMETSVDEHGQLRVQADVWFYVWPSDRGDHIRLLAPCGLKEGADKDAAASFAKRINGEFIMIRALNHEGGLDLEYYVMVEGGVTLKNIVLTARRFARICRAALDKDEAGLFR